MDLPNLAPGIGAAIGIAVSFWIMGRRKRQLEPLIAPVLQARGPLTLAETQEALAMKGFSARGKVAMALNGLAQEGKIEVIEAPPGTPLLRRVDHIRYRWKA